MDAERETAGLRYPPKRRRTVRRFLLLAILFVAVAYWLVS